MIGAYYIQKKTPTQSQNHPAKSCEYCWCCLCHFIILRKRAFVLFLDYKTLLAPAKLTLLVAVHGIVISCLKSQCETGREKERSKQLLGNHWDV